MLSNFFNKIKNHTKKVALLASLFLAVFFVLFYLVNMDIDTAEKSSMETSPVRSQEISTEIRKRLGSVTVSMESYADWAKRYGLKSRNNGPDADPDGDGLANYLEYAHGTDPENPDTDHDKYSDKQEIVNGYDPDAAAGDPKLSVELAVSKIGIAAPMVWSDTQDDRKMLKELESGVSHFMATAAPGQNGNMIISGHSSNYVWAKGDYNHIFKNLGDLEKGDVVTVKTTQKNGRVVSYSYKVSDKFVTTPDDAKIFAATQNPSLTLTTCWPLGTTFKRLIVKADIIK